MWSDVVMVREMRKAGASYRAIAVHLGVKKERVRNLCRYHGIPGVSSKPRVKYDIRRQQRMAALSRQGLSAVQIAEIIGERAGSVRNAMWRYGLFANQKSGGAMHAGDRSRI